MSTAVSVTSQDVSNNYQALLQVIQIPANATALAQIKVNQKAAEESLVRSTSACAPATLQNVQNRLPGLQGQELKKLTQQQLYNPSVMQAALCTADSVFYTSPYDVGSMYRNNRIRSYIHSLRQIGAESVEGYAMAASFENAADLFVVKAPRDPRRDDLLHELVVGLYGTNRLRQFIPNFAYIFGGFKCSPPLIDPATKEVVTWCLSNENAVNYVLYENIMPSVSAGDYFPAATGPQFVSTYLQLLYALRTAHGKIDYTHYDLHFNNVLLRTPDMNGHSGPFQIEYETERGVEYLTTDKIVTIIDYGFSHITTIDGEHFGKSDLVPLSIFPTSSWIFHDVYKFLLFAVYAAGGEGNASLINEARKIFRFFNQSEDVLSASSSQFDTRYAFPYMEKTKNLQLDDFIAYVRRVCDTSFLGARTSVPILDCDHMCLSQAGALSQIGVNPTSPLSVPDNIIEFYDLSIRLQNEGRVVEKNQIAQSFNYSLAMSNHIRDMTQILNALRNERAKLKLIDLPTIGPSQVLTPTTVAMVRSMYITVGSLVNDMRRLEFYYAVGSAIAAAYQDATATARLSEVLTAANQEIQPVLAEAGSVLARNNQYLTSIRNTPVVESVIAKRPDLAWYWTGRPLFELAFGNANTDAITSVPAVQPVQQIVTPVPQQQVAQQQVAQQQVAQPARQLVVRRIQYLPGQAAPQIQVRRIQLPY
jgi:hypothetical protein